MPVKQVTPKIKKTPRTNTQTDKVTKTVEQPMTKVQYAKPISNILILFLVVVSFFAGYLFFKVKNLEQKASSTTAVQQNTDQTASPLSVDNLKKYAKDLKLNTDKFNKCLDQGQKKTITDSDIKLGTSVGVQGTPGFFINGRFLGGAFPFNYFQEIIDKEIAGQGSASCSSYSQDLQKYCDESGNKSFNPVPKTVDVGQSPSTGAANGKVVIVEFSDFQCPYCIRAYPTVKKVLQTYSNDVKLYYVQLPLVSIHPFAEKAAEASLCAQDQGKFWQYHDKLFESQGGLTQ